LEASIRVLAEEPKDSATHIVQEDAAVSKKFQLQLKQPLKVVLHQQK
jgi:hypothetical protein